MLSIERTEVYRIFRNATVEARAFIEEQKRQRALRRETESARERATTFYGRRRAARQAAVAASATVVASTARPSEPIVVAPPPPSVWAKPKAVAAIEEIAEAAPEVKIAEEEGFTQVKAKGKGKGPRKDLRK